MANHTVVDLAEVENQGERFGVDPAELQLRMARVPLEAQNAGVSMIRLGPNFRVPWGHTHKRQEEIFVCVEGSGRMNVDGEIVEMRPYTTVRVASEGVRGQEAGPDGMTLIAFGAPNTGPGDAETIQGWWQE